MSVFLADETLCGPQTKLSSGSPSGRVLIVSPHFPPINAADHHRVRLAWPHLKKLGWTAEVLAVDPASVEGVLEHDLTRTLPLDSIVHRVRGLPVRWTRRLGLGSLAHRAYLGLLRLGDALLETGRFDLVFFSTTQFGVLPLGPRWRQRYGVPYVLDFQDEWISSYYPLHPEVAPPGGRLKYAVHRWLAQRHEPEVVRQAAQILSVSRAYNDHLRARYPELSSDRFHELPFAGAESDFSMLNRLSLKQPFFDPADRRHHWVYVGRGGPDLQFAARALFGAIRRALAEKVISPNTICLHFIGTSYAPIKRAQASLAPLAAAFGLEQCVQEHPARVPYFVGLQCLRDATALIVPGSNDPAYTASKIYTYLLARRPLLAIFHPSSPTAAVLRATRAGTLISPGADEEETSARIFREWILTRAFESVPAFDEEAFSPFTAESMTRRLVDIFMAARASSPLHRP